MRGTLLAVAVIAALAPSPVRASDSEPHNDPSATGSTGLFAVPRATTLARGRADFCVAYETVSREEGGSNVERAVVAGAFGLADRFEAFASFEPRVGIRRQFPEELAAGIPTELAPRLNDHPFATQRFKSGVGDLRVGAKYKFLGEERSYSGVAVEGTLKIPTSDKDAGIGTRKLDIAGDVIGSVEVAKALGLNGYVGLNHRTDPDAIALADELRWGGGVQGPTRSPIQGIVEFYGVRYVSKPSLSLVGFDDYSVLQGGLRLSLANGLAVTAGVNRAMSFDSTPAGADKLEKVGSFVQVSYSMRPHRLAAPPPPPPPPPAPPVNHPPSITCRADATSVRRGESVRLNAQASDPDADPVSIHWSATAGLITPATGTSVTWSSEGVDAAMATITASASDGRGGSAPCTVELRVEGPPPSPAPTVRHFTCSDFVVRSARIDNRCKAVLDDVALQLRGNPRASVSITGYTDQAGTADEREKVSRDRAENAKQFLVTTHHVEASRVTTSSGGSQHPATEESTAAGRAKNRRIEIELTLP